MAYYTNLINAWDSATQPPSGVTGTGLTAQMTTAQKVTALNGWTITGSIPTTMQTTGLAVLQCIAIADFNALTAAQQQTVLQICAMPQLIGGSASLIGQLLGTLFAGKTTTLNAFITLAQATVQPWWQANGYPAPIDINDALAAGLS